MLTLFYKVEKDLGDRIAKGLNMPKLTLPTTTETDIKTMAKTNISNVTKALDALS